MHRRILLCASCAALSTWLLISSSVRADLLGYWSANSPNNNFIVDNDFGDPDYSAEFFGEAGWSGNGDGVTGADGDYAMEFFGTDEDFAAVSIPGITYEEITIAGWLKGAQTGAWSGLFQTRDAPPIGIGYNGTSGRLTYTWNNNNGNTYNFPANHANGDDLIIPQDEWTFVALSLNPDNATLFVGPKGDDLLAVTNDIPQLTQIPSGDGWRFGEDNCCGTERNFLGLMDDFAIWDHALLPQELSQIHAGAKIPTDFTEPSTELRQVQVAGPDFGDESFSGSVSNVQYGDPSEAEGLSQFWYDGNMRNNAEAFLEAGETGSAAFPLVTAGPFVSDTTWWGGNGDMTANGEQLPRYPTPGLSGTRFDGSADEGNYGVMLKGEVFISENGEFKIRDGIDDFTMIAIDQDGNGELDDLENLTNADIGTLFPGDPIGDVLVLDDAWSNRLGGNQSEQEHAIAEFTNIDDGGEWRAIQVWMSEAGGGDSGVVYMGGIDDPDIFDEFDGGNLTQDQIDTFIIPNDQLRTVVAQVEGADASAALSDDVEYIFQVSPDDSDVFSVEDADGLYSTTLDVTGATIRVTTEGDLAAGTVVTLFDADTIAGTDMLTLLFDDPGQWDLSHLASGQITFGTGLPGDYNGDSVLDAADIDLQAVEMNKPEGEQDLAKFDHNNDGVVNGADRTNWVKQLKGTWVGDSNFDDEFNSGDLVQVFAAGKYETGTMAGWGEGDWDGNMFFDSSDLVAAFSDGGYEQGPPPPAVAAVPEPSALILLALGLLALCHCRRSK